MELDDNSYFIQKINNFRRKPWYSYVAHVSVSLKRLTDFHVYIISISSYIYSILLRAHTSLAGSH
jgi:hypothetical protein